MDVKAKKKKAKEKEKLVKHSQAVEKVFRWNESKMSMIYAQYRLISIRIMT